MRTRFLNASLALGLIVALFASFVGGASATPEQPGQSEIFFPLAFNSQASGDLSSLGGFNFSTTLIRVQNIEIFPINVSLFNAAGVPYSGWTNILVNPRASLSVSAADLGVKAGGEGVVATATWADFQTMNRYGDGATGSFAGCTAGNVLTTVTITHGTANGSDTIDVPGATNVENVRDGSSTSGQVYEANVDYFVRIDAAGTPAARVTIDWAPTGEGIKEPLAGKTYLADITQGCGAPRIAGVEQHLSANGLALDGYNAIPVQDLALAANWYCQTTVGGQGACGNPNGTGNQGPVSFPNQALDMQSRWIIPIAQTNSGWDTVLYVTNVSEHDGNAVNAVFYPGGTSDATGSPATGLIETTLKSGQTKAIRLSDVVGAGAVGDVFIDADKAVVAMVTRNKLATNMTLTTMAQPRTDTNVIFPANCSSFVQPEETDANYNVPSLCNSDEYTGAYSVAATRYAPLVLNNFHGWNTGVSVANLSSYTNNVTVKFYNQGNAGPTTVNLIIPANSMKFAYYPAQANDTTNASVQTISSAVITGQYPIAAAVDEVKYLGGPQSGHAMSYAAQNGAAYGDCYDVRNILDQLPTVVNGEACSNSYVDGSQINGLYAGKVWYDSVLALPLFHTGNGGATGATTGIELFNPLAHEGVVAMLQFVDSAGFPAAPTRVEGGPGGSNGSEQPLAISVGALQNYTIYPFTGGMQAMDTNRTLSAVIGVIHQNAEVVEAGESALVAVANDVNYSIGGDGSAVYNLAPAYYEIPYDIVTCVSPNTCP